MTRGNKLYIRAFAIWQRLIPRFDLEEAYDDDPPPELLTTIQPVFDIAEATHLYSAAVLTLDLQGAAGGFVNGVVPGEDRRLTIQSIWREGTTAASRIVVRRRGADVPISVSGTAEEVVFPAQLVLDDLDILGMQATGNAGDSSRQLSVLYRQEAQRSQNVFP